MARGFGATLGVGTTDKVTLSLATGATQRSYACWVNQHGTGGGGFGRVWESATSLDVVAQDTTTLWQFLRVWSGTDGKWNWTRPTLDQWTHLLLTYDGGATTNNPVVYHNGSAVTVTRTTGPTGTIDPVTSAYVLGNRGSDNARGWDGQLAEFAIWNRILTAEEAAALAAGYSPLFLRGALVEYVPLLRDTVSLVGAAPTATGTAVQPHPRLILPSGRWRIIAPAAAGGTTFNQSVSGILATAGSPARQDQKPLAGTLVSSGAPLRQTAKALSGTLASAGTLTKIRAVLLALSGTLTSAGTLARQSSKALAGTLTESGAAAKRLARSLSGTLATAGSVARVRAVLLSLSGTLASSGSLARQTGKVLSGNLISTGSPTRALARLLAGALTVSGAAVKQLPRALLGVLSLAGSVVVQALGVVRIATRGRASDSAYTQASASDSAYTGASASDSEP